MMIGGFDIYSNLTPDQLQKLADDAMAQAKPDDQNSIFAAIALRHAARDARDALAYRRYLMSGKTTEAMLARRFVSTPKVTTEDRGARIGWVILIHHDDMMRHKLDGNGTPYSKEQAEIIAEWLREFGAHAVEHAAHETKPRAKRRNVSETYRRLKRDRETNFVAEAALAIAFDASRLVSSQPDFVSAWSTLHEQYEVLRENEDTNLADLASYLRANKIGADT